MSRRTAAIRMASESSRQRIIGQLDMSGTCWLWQGRRDRDGYGVTSVDGTTTVRVHRALYEWLIGEITPGLVIDHLCKVRHCANPVHLDIVTSVENGRRSVPAYVRMGMCRYGHPLDGLRSNGSRYCKTCNSLAHHESYVRRKAARIPTTSPGPIWKDNRPWV